MGRIKRLLAGGTILFVLAATVSVIGDATAEADSRRWHLLIDAFDTDRRRDIAAQLAGWMVLRIKWKMVTEEPEYVVDSVRRALAMRVPAGSGGS